MKYLSIYEIVANGMEILRANFPAHRARIEEFHARGTLLASGPIVDEAGVPSGTAYGVFTTREAAEDFVAGDPFVIHGAVARWRIENWNDSLL
jgi:uncharacterized protein YciI